MGLLSLLFKPDMEPIIKIGRYLASNQYEQCANYLKEENPKSLKRCINYQLGVKRKQGQRGMHAYKLLTEIFYVVFKAHSRHYDPDFYKECVQNEPENERSLCYEVKQIAPYFAEKDDADD